MRHLFRRVEATDKSRSRFVCDEDFNVMSGSCGFQKVNTKSSLRRNHKINERQEGSPIVRVGLFSHSKLVAGAEIQLRMRLFITPLEKC